MLITTRIWSGVSSRRGNLPLITITPLRIAITTRIIINVFIYNYNETSRLQIAIPDRDKVNVIFVRLTRFPNVFPDASSTFRHSLCYDTVPIFSPSERTQWWKFGLPQSFGPGGVVTIEKKKKNNDCNYRNKNLWVSRWIFKTSRPVISLCT